MNGVPTCSCEGPYEGDGYHHPPAHSQLSSAVVLRKHALSRTDNDHPSRLASGSGCTTSCSDAEVQEYFDCFDAAQCSPAALRRAVSSSCVEVHCQTCARPDMGPWRYQMACIPECGCGPTVQESFFSNLAEWVQDQGCAPDSFDEGTLSWEYYCSEVSFPDDIVESIYLVEGLGPSDFPPFETTLISTFAQVLTDGTPSDVTVAPNDITVTEVVVAGGSPGVLATLVTLNVATPFGARAVGGDSVSDLIYQASLDRLALGSALFQTQFGYFAMLESSELIAGRIAECTAANNRQEAACLAGVRCGVMQEQFGCAPSCLCDSPKALGESIAALIQHFVDDFGNQTQCNATRTTVSSLAQCAGCSVVEASDCVAEATCSLPPNGSAVCACPPGLAGDGRIEGTGCYVACSSADQARCVPDATCFYDQERFPICQCPRPAEGDG